MASKLGKKTGKKIEYKYYNEELKERYLSQRKKDLPVAIKCTDVQFRKIASAEYELDKDVSDWNYYEIIEYYKLLNITSITSLTCFNSIFSMYTDFCLENGLVKDHQNHFLECTQEVLLTCLNKAIFDKKIVSRETVLEWIEQLPNARDQFILLSLFEYGKSKDFIDIFNVKQSDCDKEKKTLKLSNRTVNISDKLISIIEECGEADTYYSISKNGTKKMPLVDYGFIVKSYPNQNNDLTNFRKGRNIYTACQRIFDYVGVGKWMSPNAISESGKLHMIKAEAKKLNITPYEYLYSKDIVKVEQQFNFKMERKTYYKTYKEYLV